jgi:predicted nuclease of restriction endonuclease-like RecB superfamily
MLTRDLLRYGTNDGKIIPKLLKTSPTNLNLTQALLDHWRGGVGRTIGELEEAATAILAQSRSLQTAKGLQKIIVDACTFREADSCSELRERALLASAARLRSLATMPADPELYRGQLASDLGLTSEQLGEQLYGDLPHAAQLASAPEFEAATVIARYNLAQCQGLLLSARELTITLHDSDTGLRRKLLKALRWQRLLADIHPAGSALRIVISGPGAVLDQASRYGLNLALFLPALACAKRWQASAWITPLRGGATQELLLSDETGLIGDTRFSGYVPAEIRSLEQDIVRKQPTWKMLEPQLIPLRSGELVVPDLQLEILGQVVAVEFFHRWHSLALTRRRADLAQGEAPTLILGVDRAVAKQREHADLASDALFAERGFLFNDLPTMRALTAAVARRVSPGAR